VADRPSQLEQDVGHPGQQVLAIEGRVDDAIAVEITQRLHANDFSVSNQAFQAPTPSGTRTLRNVIGVRSGLSGGSIVVIAHRDATGSPAKLAESGTGVLLDLARVLSGETLNHTIVLASTSGSTGAAGATQLIRALPGPIDAVLVLGDMASRTVHPPLVVPGRMASRWRRRC